MFRLFLLQLFLFDSFACLVCTSYKIYTWFFSGRGFFLVGKSPTLMSAHGVPMSIRIFSLTSAFNGTHKMIIHYFQIINIFDFESLKLVVPKNYPFSLIYTLEGVLLFLSWDFSTRWWKSAGTIHFEISKELLRALWYFKFLSIDVSIKEENAVQVFGKQKDLKKVL